MNSQRVVASDPSLDVAHGRKNTFKDEPRAENSGHFKVVDGHNVPVKGLPQVFWDVNGPDDELDPSRSQQVNPNPPPNALLACIDVAVYSW